MKSSIPAILLTTLCLSLTGCFGGKNIQDGPPKHYKNVNNIPNAQPKAEPKSRYGNPSSYVVHGKRYHVLNTAQNYNKVGYASWYGSKFHDRLTSNREPYDVYGMTAASKDLPLPTYVRVTNLENGKSIIVRVNDRGPFVKDRIIDLTYAGAAKLGYVGKGTALVRVTAINPTQWAKEQGVGHNVPEHHLPAVYLQVAAYQEQANAERMRWRMKQLANQPVRIEIATSHSGQSIYRVQIGPVVGVSAYDNVITKLASAGIHNPLTVPAT